MITGAPGAGKGTLGKLLSRHTGLPHIASGDLLRVRIAAGETGSYDGAAIGSGAYAPDQMVMDLVRERLNELDCTEGFLLDGFPRTVPQAEQLSQWFLKRGQGLSQIHLRVDYNIIIARLAGRLSCAQCGEVYHAEHRPPVHAGLCDADGSELSSRDDDAPEVVGARLARYDCYAEELFAVFCRAGWRRVEIEASLKSPEQVAQEACRFLAAAVAV